MPAIKCKFRPSFLGYQCYIASQIISNDLISLQGSHRDEKTNNDVKNIYFHGCTFVGFPKNIDELLPELTGLVIQDSKISNLTREHFKELSGLTTLYITRCELKTLPSDLFQDLIYLERISFANNKLEEIGADILEGLFNLNIVDFRGNVNINMWFNLNDKTSSTLDDVKREIRLKCKPKENHKSAAGQDQNLLIELQKLSIENANLKVVLQNQQVLIKKQQEEIKNTLKRPNSTNSIFNDLKNVLADDDFKDFTINVGNLSFKVHKFLFAARCPALAEAFKANPQLEELNLRDIPEVTFKAVHDFVYTNKLAADANHLEIFLVSARLKMKELNDVAATHLLATLDEKNSFEVLVLAHKFNHEVLRKKAFENICTKIFPDRKLDDELATEPEKLRKMIEKKRMLDKEYEKMWEEEGAVGFDKNY